MIGWSYPLSAELSLQDRNAALIVLPRLGRSQVVKAPGFDPGIVPAISFFWPSACSTFLDLNDEQAR